MSEEEGEEEEVGEDDVETEADLLEGDIAVAEVTYCQLLIHLITVSFQINFGYIVSIEKGKCVVWRPLPFYTVCKYSNFSNSSVAGQIATCNRL